MTRLSDTTINLTQLHRLVVKALCAHGTDAKGTALVFMVEVLAADGHRTGPHIQGLIPDQT